MRALVFDTGPLISLTMNNLLFILEPLKKQFDGHFFIAESVKDELVNKPSKIKRFEFEALQINKLIEEGTIEVIGGERIRKRALSFLDIANSVYRCKGQNMRPIHLGEAETIAAALELEADACVIDERTTRMMIENPKELREIFRIKLHCNVDADSQRLKELKIETDNLSILRSVELIVAAYELKLLDRYLPSADDARSVLLDSVLWGAKLNGCAVSEKEIEEIKRLERKRNIE